LATLYYWRVDQDSAESDLYRPLRISTEDGSEPRDIVRVAREYGLHAEYYRDSEYSLDRLRTALGRGDTVIVGYQAWLVNPGTNPHWTSKWDDGHYSVVVAMDEDFIYLMDPSAGIGYGYIPLDEFLTRWHDVEKNRRGRWIHRQRMAIEVRGTTPTLTLPGPLIRVL
jgi:predicted double-glycine peptidase